MGQRLQDALPSVEYLPLSHFVQTIEPAAGANVPATQAEHAAEPEAVEAEPAGHAAQPTQPVCFDND